MAADRRRLTKLGRRLARLPVDPRLGRMVLEPPTRSAACARCSWSPPRCRSRIRASGRPSIVRRPTRPTPGSPPRARTSSPSCACGTTSASSSGRCRRARSAGCAAPSSSTSCGCASGRTCSASCARRRAPWGSTRRRSPRIPTACTRRCSPGCCRRSGCATARRREYRGARGAKFLVGRESAAAKRLPRWVMAGGLVETNRLWARTVAAIQPEWAERAGEHLVTRTYGEPVWDERARRGDRRRTGDAVRPAARHRTADRARPRRPRPGPRAVHPPCAGARRVARPPCVHRRQPRRAGHGGRGRRARPPCGAGGRGHAVRLLRPAGARRGGLHPALRPVVEAGQAHHARPADVHAGRARRRRRRRARRARLPHGVAPGRPGARRHLPLRARRARRRRHRARAAGRAQPGARRRLRLGRRRVPRRARRVARPHPAQAPAARR